MGVCCSTGAIDADMVKNMEPRQSTPKQKVVICGGDHAAHIFTALAATDPNNEVHLISLFYTDAKESEDTPEGESDHGTITVKVSPTNRQIKSTPSSIFKDPNKNLVDADIVILSLPAFSHGKALQAIKENIKPRENKKTLVAVFSAASGLEREWQSVFGADNEHFVLLSCTTLPWTCKTLTFREKAEIVGTKKEIQVCIKSTDDPDKYNKLYIEQMAGIIGESPKIKDYGHILNMSLSAMNAIIHPSIMYAKWKDYDGELKLDKKPLFYWGISENTANIISELSDEVIKITKCISKETGLALVTKTIYKWYKKTYGDAECGDTSSLYKIITTNKAYKGITHPMKQCHDDGKFVPNYRYRYLSEDIPYGLVVIKGLSMILSEENKCETPLMDKIIKWAQGVLNKEYLKYQEDGSVVAGKDIRASRAPQRYGIKSIKEFV